MAAYCLFDIIEIHNPDAMNEYRSKVVETVSKFNGIYTVIGGGVVKEGNLKPVFPVMIEFPSMEIAESWYNSPEYQPLKQLRLSAVTSNAVFFEGNLQPESAHN